ncbi:MAG: class I SAM-dependent methyltransferase [Halobacteriota archaeon]
MKDHDKVKIKLSGVSATMLFPLWGRAQVSKEYSSLFYDEKAIELVEKIDYDFSTSDMPFVGVMLDVIRKGNLLPMFSLVALMAKQFDDKIKEYITDHPRASVVNLGAGLDATFYRVDNRLIKWYDLDLPAVIDVRRQFFPEPDRVTYIAKSLLDPSWCKEVNTKDGVFMIAEAVFQFFDEAQMKQFFLMLADNFPGGEIVFTTMSRSDGFRGWFDMFPPEKRDAMKAVWMEAMKEWWEKVPKDQKDKAITALKTPTKPKGTEWSDLEAWWNQLSDEENAEAMRDLMSSFSLIPSGRVGMWAPKDANEFTKWDGRITVIDQLSLSKNIPRDLLSADMRRVMEYFDESGGWNIFHLRV